MLAHSLGISTLIFDEIDSGVGGSVAIAIGKKLREISKNIQVLAITHSPQVASFADKHFYISKYSESIEGSTDLGSEIITKTDVKVLSKEESRKEIARMLSGDELSKEAMAAADKLIENVKAA